MTTREFIEAWDELSPKQKETAEWETGPILVLAGPGSGKTRVLTCHIAHILNKTTDENFRILGLTFTNKAASEMRDRVSLFVPGQEARVFLGTFHSFCADILRQHGTHVGIAPDFQIISQDAELQAFLNAAVANAQKSWDFISQRDEKTLPVIRRLKSLLVLPEDCCSDTSIAQDIQERMSVIYPAYEAELAKNNALDFDSLILRTYDLFTKFPAFARRYRSVYPYVCIDEFQDTNYAQYQLIRALLGDDFNNLFVVADDDQIIYQWNGASYQRIEELIRDYEPFVSQLTMNYRCPSRVVEISNSLISNNFLRTADKKKVVAFRSDQDTDEVRLLGPYADFTEELNAVARDIRKRHPLIDSVVILARHRRLLDDAKYVLTVEHNLPAMISQRKDAFQSPPFVWLTSVLKLSNSGFNSAYLTQLVGSFEQLTRIAMDPSAVATKAQLEHQDYLRAWLDLASYMFADPSFEHIASLLSTLPDSSEFGIHTFSEVTIGWLDQLVQADHRHNSSTELFADYQEERAVWYSLCKDIEHSLSRPIHLGAFLQELQMRSKEPNPTPNTILLMTIHASKAKEFDHVYIIGAVEDELPSYQSRQKGDESPEMEEERRNCFVAITRAIRTLTLSYAENYSGWQKSPSRFLFEMGLLDN